MVSPSTSLYLSGISLLSWAFQTQGRCALFPSLLCHRRCSIALCRKRIDGIRPDPNRFLLQREPEHLPAVDKLKRKLGHEENVHAFFLVRNKVEVAALEQKRLGIGNGSVGMFSSLIVRACRHALPFYHLLPIFSLQLASDAWFLNTPEQLLSFILADEGFDVWVGNVDGTRWSHGHRYYSVKNKVCGSSLTYRDADGVNDQLHIFSNKFKAIHSWAFTGSYDSRHHPFHLLFGSCCSMHFIHFSYFRGTIISFAAFTQMTTGFIQMVLTMGINQLNFKSEWGTNLLVSLRDTRLSCGDMLSSITGSCAQHYLFPLCLGGFYFISDARL
ncbi:hypothetical protein HN873_023559 [Arachis hypogaea]